MKNVFTKKWWVASLIRALRTVAQTAIATIGTAAMVSEVNWMVVLSTAGLAGVLSLLMSLAGLPEVDTDYIDATPEVKDDSEDTKHDPDEG